MKHLLVITLVCCINLSSCGQKDNSKKEKNNKVLVAQNTINHDGKTIQKRFDTPNGFTRKPVEENSFADYLRNLPLKPVGAKVKYYNGTEKENDVYEAVVDMEISNNNLQQCADAIMRLRGEYFYNKKEYDKISFTLTNGFKMDYLQWTKGFRVKVNGNHTEWQKNAGPSNTYQDFRNYMEFVFTYAGTLSMSKSLKKKDIKKLSIGDVFILGGSPGHAVLVVDLAENEKGEKVFMLAQSYMPAQETQILKNLNDDISPWYNVASMEKLFTPEWTFEWTDLKTW